MTPQLLFIGIATGIVAWIVVELYRGWRLHRRIESAQAFMNAASWTPETVCRHCGQPIGALVTNGRRLEWADKGRGFICAVRSGDRETRFGHEPPRTFATEN